MAASAQQGSRIDRNQYQTRQLQHPVYPDTEQTLIDKPIDMMKPNGTHRDKSADKGQPQQGQPAVAQFCAQKIQAQGHHHANASNQSKDEMPLKGAPVVIPALGLGNAAPRCSQRRLQVQLFVQGQKYHQRRQQRPEHRSPPRCFAPPNHCNRQTGAGRVGRNGDPTQYSGVTNLGRPAIRHAVYQIAIVQILKHIAPQNPNLSTRQRT